MITQAYKLDMVPGGRPTIVHVSQYDAGSRDLTFELYSGGMPWAVPEGATVTIDGTKADRKAFSYTAAASGSTVAVTVTQQMTAARGLAECQLTVTQGSSVLGSANFVLNVERAALPEDADMSQTDIASLEVWKNQSLNAMQAAQAAQGKAETAQAKAETAQSKAATAQGKAEAAQAAGETARDAAKTAQAKAEAARDAAKTAQAKAEMAQSKSEAAKAAAETARDAAATSAQSAEASAQNASATATASANSADQAETARAAAVAAQGKAEAATSGKADKKTPSASGNVALLDAGGNLLDSGKQLTPAGIGAAASSHTHSQSDISGLSTALSGKANASHSHGAGDITSGTLPIERGGTGRTDGAAVGLVDYAESNRMVKISWAESSLATCSYFAAYTPDANIKTISVDNARKAMGAAPSSHTHENYLDKNTSNEQAVAGVVAFNWDSGWGPIAITGSNRENGIFFYNSGAAKHCISLANGGAGSNSGLFVWDQTAQKGVWDYDQVNYKCNFSAMINYASDRTLKKDITEIPVCLIDGLKPMQYHYKDGDKDLHWGFVAQDVIEEMQELGLSPDDYALVSQSEHKDGQKYTLGYNELIAQLVMKCQELQAQVDDINVRLTEKLGEKGT